MNEPQVSNEELYHLYFVSFLSFYYNFLFSFIYNGVWNRWVLPSQDVVTSNWGRNRGCNTQLINSFDTWGWWACKWADGADGADDEIEEEIEEEGGWREGSWQCHRETNRS